MYVPDIPLPDGKSGPPKPLGNKTLLAAYMRAMPTRHEQIMITLLQAMNVYREFKFQEELFGYIADFSHCGVRKAGEPCVPFIIEVDGNTHFNAKGKAWDTTRDSAFVKHGYSVLRISHKGLVGNPRGAMQAVKEMLESKRGKQRPTVHRFHG